MASKVFENICNAELGKPYMLQKKGSSSARNSNGIEGKGESKKRMTICNELYKGSKFALIRKDADLLYGILLHEWRHDPWMWVVQLHRKVRNLQTFNWETNGIKSIGKQLRDTSIGCKPGLQKQL